MTHKVYMMHDRKVAAEFAEGAEDALIEFFGHYESVRTDRVEINNLEHWRHQDYMGAENTLRPWYSLDWYMQYVKEKSDRTDQLDGDIMMQLLYSEPWRKTIRHTDLVLVDDDIYAPDCRFVVGLAIGKVGTIISTHRFKAIRDDRLRIETFKTAVMHEMGHVYGLPSQNRDATEESLGRHCTKLCIMRQGLTVPRDWEKMTRDRLRVGPFCGYCIRDLSNFTL